MVGASALESVNLLSPIVVLVYTLASHTLNDTCYMVSDELSPVDFYVPDFCEVGHLFIC